MALKRLSALAEWPYSRFCIHARLGILLVCHKTEGKDMGITKDESGHHLKPAGRLDIKGSERLRDALREFAKGGSNSIVDVSEVEACDTTALQLLYSVRKTVESGGGRFMLAGLSSGLVESSAALGLSLKELTGESENAA